MFESKGEVMRRVSAVAAVLLVLSVVPAIARIGVEGPNGFMIVMNAYMEPNHEWVPSGVVAKDAGRIHRFVPDRGQRRYFAYDLVVEPIGDSRLRVRVEPLSLAGADLANLTFIESSWTAVPLLTYPVVPEVRSGDTLSIDLLQNPATGQRVVDRLEFTRPASTAAAPARPARDFALTDVHLRLENARISINGDLVEASSRIGGAISGSTLWLYLQGRGRFVMSLAPGPQRGANRVGEVTGRQLLFAAGRDTVSVQCTSPIAPGEGRFNLYVRHEPEWRPSGREVAAPLLLGAND
jgi:hypothetical protein